MFLLTSMTHQEFTTISKALDKAKGEILFTLDKAKADVERVLIQSNETKVEVEKEVLF